MVSANIIERNTCHQKKYLQKLGSRKIHCLKIATELRQGTFVKKFYIDYHTEKLDKEVQDFGEFLKVTLVQLSYKN